MVVTVVTPTNSTLYCFNANGVASAVQTHAEDNEPWGLGACIGNDPGKGSGYTFIGSMADVLLYNASLSPLQLYNLYSAGVGAANLPPPLAPLIGVPLPSVQYRARPRILARKPIPSAWARGKVFIGR